MKTLKRHPLAGIVVFVLFAGLLTVWKPLSIRYHHRAMTNIWWDSIGMQHAKGPVDKILEVLGVVTVPKPRFLDPYAMMKIHRHREALVGLGYYVKRDFQLSPRAADLRLIHAVAGQAGQEPIAVFQYDAPASPTQKVVGLSVYAPAKDMPRWEQFVAELQKSDESDAEPSNAPNAGSASLHQHR